MYVAHMQAHAHADCHKKKHAISNDSCKKAYGTIVRDITLLHFNFLFLLCMFIQDGKGAMGKIIRLRLVH